jgi:hypothetical protein
VSKHSKPNDAPRRLHAKGLRPNALFAATEQYVRARVPASVKHAAEWQPDHTAQLNADGRLTELKAQLGTTANQAWKAVHARMSDEPLWLDEVERPSNQDVERFRRRPGRTFGGGWNELESGIGRLLEDGEPPVGDLLKAFGYDRSGARSPREAGQRELARQLDGYMDALHAYATAWHDVYELEQSLQRSTAGDLWERA